MTTDRPGPVVRTCLLLALLAATVLAYAPTFAGEFVGLDDDQYVTENPHVLGGLDAASVRWAFTTTHAANWHPLTWLSHMLDVELFGLDAGWHHGVGLALHLGCTLLLFAFVARGTGTFWSAWLVAALFALHPLRVESVAWVSERKDVLSALFGLAALWLYVHGGRARRWGTPLALGLGLMAKPMLVTMPLLLLLVDVWPGARHAQVGWRRRVLEKLPLFVLAAVGGALTLYAQSAGGAVADVRTFPLAARVANALLAYVRYAADFAWPAKLACFHPHPLLSGGDLRLGSPAVIAAAVGLALATLLALRERVRRPFVTVGWLAFLGLLVPVIGLVQVGSQGHAERYAYLPVIGLQLILVFGLRSLICAHPAARKPVVGLVALALVALGARTYAQVGVWKDSMTLFEHALGVEESALAHHNLGHAHGQRGDWAQAERHYRAALALEPGHPSARTGLGVVLFELGRVSEAVGELRQALRNTPDDASALVGLGRAYADQGRWDEARSLFERALAAAPERIESHNDIGATLAGNGELDAAQAHFQRVLELRPRSATAHANLGVLELNRGRLPEAERWTRAALALEPEHAIARANLAIVLRSRAAVQE